MADDTGTASAAGSSPAPTASSSPTAAVAAPAISAPASEGSAAPVPTSGTGEPPHDRWPDILKSTRDKTRGEVEAEFRQKYGKYDAFETDPLRAVQDWLEQANQHSQYGPQVAQLAARLLQARRGQNPQTVEEPTPDVPIVDANGNVTGQTYSATQLRKWRDWDWAQKQATFDQRLQPLEAMRTEREQWQQQQAVERQAVEASTKTLEGLRQDPTFAAHEAKVRQTLIDHPEFGANVHQAYAHVLATDILPGISKNEQSKVLETLKTQAAGGTISPARTGATPTPKFKSFGEAARYFTEHPEEAATLAER